MALTEERVRDIVIEMQAANQQVFVDKLKVDMNEMKDTVQATIA